MIKKLLAPYALLLTITFATGALVTSNTASAITGSDWQAGSIVDDITFYNNASMSTGDIQSFLNALVPVCDTWGAKPHETIAGKTRAQVGTEYGNPPPYICLKDYYENPTTHQTNFNPTASIPAGALSAAQIIYNAAQEYKINPRVLLVTIKKEAANNLIADDWPWAGQYRSALGYGCPDTAPCDAQYYGLYNQITNAARQFRRYADNPSSYRHKAGQTISIQYHPSNSVCASPVVYLENQASAGLYNYTPYQPNTAALSNLRGTGDGCSSYGNRNFWVIWNEWFGSTHAFTLAGLNYSIVFDPQYYLDNNPDLKAAFSDNQLLAFSHFLNYGLNEGRQGNADFNVNSYKNRYYDLRRIYGNNNQAYARHYILYGKAEGRVASGDYLGGVSTYGGVDYSAVYNFDYYSKNNPDIKAAYGLDDNRAFSHFLNYGLSEGRQGNADFNVNSYKNRYYDLRRIYGENTLFYARHYVLYGKAEGRTTTGDYLGGTSIYNGVDYSAVYSFDYYMKNNPDIKSAFGLNDVATLRHFVLDGLNEGRQGSLEFNVNAYRSRYSDLQIAFGTNLRLYYLHYIHYGKAEGRTATLPL